MSTQEPHQSGCDAPILVVDDEPHICSFIELALTDERYSVITAQNGIAALDILRARRTSVVLLDLQMPKLSGRELLSAYQDLPGPHAPIVVLTASRVPEESATDLGAQGVLRKPFDVGKLLEIVEQFAEPG